MSIVQIPLHDILPQGQNILVDDANIWAKPIAEFGMDCRVVVPLCAELFLLPVEGGGGCLIRGRLTGEVKQACDRCAEDAPTVIDHSIEVFVSEPLPNGLPNDMHRGTDTAEDTEDKTTPQDVAEDHVHIKDGVALLDVAGLCWEEFMLALPLRPLCSTACKGLCAQCGVNLNEQTCSCHKDEGDPRLAALRNIKIQKTK